MDLILQPHQLLFLLAEHLKRHRVLVAQPPQLA
jgi:hypothetical protein